MKSEMNLDHIIETFDLLDDWELRYQYLDELGEQLPPMASTDKTDETKVHACTSDVWVKPHANDTGKLIFSGDCNTAIIKGVVALLSALFSNKTAEQVQGTDIDKLFKKLQLFEHLSPYRHVGVYAIVEKMKKQAQELA